MRIHFIGIGGTGMAAAAGLALQLGHEVRGSDGPLYPPMSTLLSELGITIYAGYRAENLDWHPDLVVVGNSCSKEHVEYVATRARGIAYTSFPKFLSDEVLADRQNIVIAGTHGKTTTSTLTRHLLSSVGLNPGYLVGGLPQRRPGDAAVRSFALGAQPYFVIEGDEYDTACFDKHPKFFHYRPCIVILTGIEFDHADIYNNIDEIKVAFAGLIQRIPKNGVLFVYTGSPIAVELAQQAPCNVVYYGSGDFAHWVITTRVPTGHQQQLTVSHAGQPWGTLSLPLIGQHNAENALAVIALGHHLGLGVAAIEQGFKTFPGVKRRQEIVGEINGITLIDDFAHHPTAITLTLQALRQAYPSGRLIALFEPRSATSRRNIFQHEFAQALANADITLIAPLFSPEKIPTDQRLNVDQLAADIRYQNRVALSLPSVTDIVSDIAKRAQPGDVIVAMSSGSFENVLSAVRDALQANST